MIIAVMIFHASTIRRHYASEQMVVDKERYLYA